MYWLPAQYFYITNTMLLQGQPQRKQHKFPGHWSLLFPVGLVGSHQPAKKNKTLNKKTCKCQVWVLGFGGEEGRGWVGLVFSFGESALFWWSTGALIASTVLHVAPCILCVLDWLRNIKVAEQYHRGGQKYKSSRGVSPRLPKSIKVAEDYHQSGRKI